MKFPLSTEQADALLDPIVRMVIRKVVRKNVPMDEQHNRFSDILEVMAIPTFKKKQSLLDLEKLRDIADEATNKIDQIAKKLAQEVGDDPIDQGMALIEYRRKLRATFRSRITLVKARDGHKKWQDARKVAEVAGAIAVGISAGYVAGKVARHLLRNEDGKRAIKKANEDIAEEKRKAEEAERRKKEQQSKPS